MEWRTPKYTDGEWFPWYTPGEKKSKGRIRHITCRSSCKNRARIQLYASIGLPMWNKHRKLKPKANNHVTGAGRRHRTQRQGMHVTSLWKRSIHVKTYNLHLEYKCYRLKNTMTFLKSIKIEKILKQMKQFIYKS